MIGPTMKWKTPADDSRCAACKEHFPITEQIEYCHDLDINNNPIGAKWWLNGYLVHSCGTLQEEVSEEQLDMIRSSLIKMYDGRINC